MSIKVGSIKGTLRLRVGDTDLSLGTINIPLRAINSGLKEVGSDEITIGLATDLKEMRWIAFMKEETQ